MLKNHEDNIEFPELLSIWYDKCLKWSTFIVDSNKKESNNSPGTPAFIHGEMSNPSACPSSLVVLMGANNWTTSSMICWNADKIKLFSAV